MPVVDMTRPCACTSACNAPLRGGYAHARPGRRPAPWAHPVQAPVPEAMRDVRGCGGQRAGKGTGHQPARHLVGDGDVRPRRRHVDHECLDLGRGRRPRHRRERHPVGHRSRGAGLCRVHPHRQQDRRPVRTQTSVCPGSAGLCDRRAGDGAGPERDVGLHLLGDHRWSRRVAPAARDAVAHPWQLRGSGPEGHVRPRRRGRGRRSRRRTADRRLHHHIPVLSRGVPARGHHHRDRAVGHPTRS